MDHTVDKIWRATYAEEVLKKSREYNAEEIPLPPNEVLGVYLDTEVLHVRIFMNGKTRSVISIPAYYVLDEFDEILTGSRAVVYTKLHDDVSLNSVLEFMQENDRGSYSTLGDAGINHCIALMKELKRNLAQTALAQIKYCVLTTSVPEIVTRRNVQTAMENVGFQVIRSMSVVEACALSKVYLVTQKQRMLVRVIANHERQNLTAECADDVLESLEYTFGNTLPDATPDMVNYYMSDAKSRTDLGRESDNYEELAVAAASGAAVQGTYLIGETPRRILPFPIFPWKIGLEIVTRQGEKGCPLTWLSEKPENIALGTKPVNISLESGIRKKLLNLYLGSNHSKELIRQWDTEKIFREFPENTRQFEVWIEIGFASTSLTLIFQAEGKKVALDLNQYAKVKINPVPLTTEYVPLQIIREVQCAAEAFCQEAERAEEMDMDSAIGKGLQMIVRQVQEVLKECNPGNTKISVAAFIEKILSVKDNVEYGLTGAERTTKRMEYLNEKLLLTRLCTKLRDNLYKLNITPIESNGLGFDPHIHEAVHIEETDAIEEDLVVRVVQNGYFFGEKLYRPARVVVSKRIAGI